MINIQPRLQKALEQMQIHQLSDVQTFAYQPIQAHQDTIIITNPAAGKTLSYLLPLLNTYVIQEKPKHQPRIIIYVPTKENAYQQAHMIRQMLLYTEGIRTAIYVADTPMNQQIRQYKQGADIIIGTPQRIHDHFVRHTIKDHQLQTIVFDEFDAILQPENQPFLQDICQKYAHLQFILTSATNHHDALPFFAPFLKQPIIYNKQETKHTQNYKIIYQEYEKHPFEHIENDLTDEQTIIFTSYKSNIPTLLSKLRSTYSITSLHGDLLPKQRKQIMQDFSQGKYQILIASDLVARGLNFPQVTRIISDDAHHDPRQYIHRFGRASRHGQPSTIIVMRKKKRHK